MLKACPTALWARNLRRAERIFSERELGEDVRSLVLKEDAGASHLPLSLFIPPHYEAGNVLQDSSQVQCPASP